ncbi:DUF2516 family protein [Nocardioides yefusunii]|uniref:DUF2516 family protein n=1 Tax=Nocardioides yefusunii TaxID=2500546 RepID=A0ABW1QUA0_9ACTN|nr:DUF2516 family protein [Nocardioides yefusunii]
MLSSLTALVGLVATLGFVVVKAYALISALTFSEQAYEASAKLTKVAWCAILGLALVAQLVFRSPIQMLNLVGLVAALVFLADVRPALRDVTPR